MKYFGLAITAGSMLYSGISAAVEKAFAQRVLDNDYDIRTIKTKTFLILMLPIEVNNKGKNAKEYLEIGQLLIKANLLDTFDGTDEDGQDDETGIGGNTDDNGDQYVSQGNGRNTNTDNYRQTMNTEEQPTGLNENDQYQQVNTGEQGVPPTGGTGGYTNVQSRAGAGSNSDELNTDQRVGEYGNSNNVMSTQQTQEYGENGVETQNTAEYTTQNTGANDLETQNTGTSVGFSNMAAGTTPPNTLPIESPVINPSTTTTPGNNLPPNSTSPGNAIPTAAPTASTLPSGSPATPTSEPTQ